LADSIASYNPGVKQLSLEISPFSQQVLTNTQYNGFINCELLSGNLVSLPPGQSFTLSYRFFIAYDTLSSIRNIVYGQAWSKNASIGEKSVFDYSSDRESSDLDGDFISNEPEDNSFTIIKIPSVLYIPNGFSPNGDNINDNWKIRGAPKSAKLLVFNRWGQQVYSDLDFTPLSPWDGRSNGQLVSRGTYYYILSEGDQTFSGFVTVEY